MSSELLGLSLDAALELLKLRGISSCVINDYCAKRIAGVEKRVIRVKQTQNSVELTVSGFSSEPDMKGEAYIGKDI